MVFMVYTMEAKNGFRGVHHGRGFWHFCGEHTSPLPPSWVPLVHKYHPLVSIVAQERGKLAVREVWIVSTLDLPPVPVSLKQLVDLKDIFSSERFSTVSLYLCGQSISDCVREKVRKKERVCVVNMNIEPICNILNTHLLGKKWRENVSSIHPQSISRMSGDFYT